MTIEEMQKKIVEFRDNRDWKQFHNFKDLAISLVLESTELLEHSQWKTKEEFDEYMKTEKAEDVKEEIADVFYWVLLISHDLGIDLEEALQNKMKKNDLKYSIQKAKGNHKKYTEL